MTVHLITDGLTTACGRSVGSGDVEVSTDTDDVDCGSCRSTTWFSEQADWQREVGHPPL
jgi:hypothetical protein